MGKHFPLDLSKFKKIREDAHKATLVHPDGHEITIAKKPLSAKMRGQIAGLALADGGQVPQKSDAPPEPDKKKTAEFEKGFNAGDVSPGQALNNVKKALGFDDGGIVEDIAKLAPLLLMADGGNVADKSEDDKSIGQIINYPGAGPSPKPSPKKMADGGDVAPEAAPQEAIATPSNPPQLPAALMNPNAPGVAAPGGASASWEAPTAEPAAEAPSGLASAQKISAQGPQDVYGNEAYNQAYMKGLNEQKSGLRGEAQAASQQAQLENKSLGASISQQEQIANHYAEHLKGLQDEYQNFQHDVQNQHIDPQHYLNSMGTGQKVRSAIGLILGGLSSGISGQPNPALSYLNSQIANDIEAQKSNLGKSENLLNANIRQFGNIRDASQMTMAMQQGIVANQLRQAAAQTTDQAAKSRAIQAAGQLDQQAAPVLSQIAMRRTLVSGANQGMIPPENVIRAIVPPGEQAAHYKELQTAQNMSRARDNVLSAFDQVNGMTLGGAFSPKQRDALTEPVLAQLVKDSEGRITPQDTKMIESLFPSALDMSNETRALKRSQLNKFVSEKMNFPMLKAVGINTDSFGRYNPRGQARFDESAPKLGK